MFIQNPLVMVTGQVFPRLEAIEKCAATAGGAGSIPFNEGYKAMDILKGQYEPWDFRLSYFQTHQYWRLTTIHHDEIDIEHIYIYINQ